MHKLFPGATPHKEALKDPTARRADGVASWFSRNCLKRKFNKNYIRMSLISPVNSYNKKILSENRDLLWSLFNEEVPEKLHWKCLHSKLLNFYSESRIFPFTSLKYHLLLSCAFYHNFKNGLTKLYLYENEIPDSNYQIIYVDNEIKWTIQHKKDVEKILGPIYPYFNLTWARRINNSIIGGDRTLSSLLMGIKSWSTALATIEEYKEAILK